LRKAADISNSEFGILNSELKPGFRQPAVTDSPLQKSIQPRLRGNAALPSNNSICEIRVKKVFAWFVYFAVHLIRLVAASLT